MFFFFQLQETTETTEIEEIKEEEKEKETDECLNKETSENTKGSFSEISLKGSSAGKILFRKSM